MYTIIKVSFILTLFSLASLSESARLKKHPYFAAVCVAKASYCDNFFAYYSGGCKPRIEWWQQPKSCQLKACHWCRDHGNKYYPYPCHNVNISKTCKLLSSPKSTPKKPRTPRSFPKTKSNGKCTWTGKGDNIVIDLSRVPLGNGWDRISRYGKNGIIFNRSPSPGISPPGKYGKMCFNVRAPKSGNYYLTAISFAPHHTEHNDVWVETSKGFELWQRGNKHSYVPPGKFLKAYQNHSFKGMSDQFKTIDFNGHRFLVPNVRAGEVFRVCISGRSKRYEMYRLILIKCTGMYCRGGIMYGLFDMPPSKCY